MKRINIPVDDQLFKDISQKAKSFGLKPGTFARNLVKDNFNKKQDDTTLMDIHRAVTALIPVLAEAFGLTGKATSEQIQALKNKLSKSWEEAYFNEKSKIS